MSTYIFLNKYRENYCIYDSGTNPSGDVKLGEQVRKELGYVEYDPKNKKCLIRSFNAILPIIQDNEYQLYPNTNANS
jgi:hypothetical protein